MGLPLLDPTSLQWNQPPRKKKRKDPDKKLVEQIIEESRQLEAKRKEIDRELQRYDVKLYLQDISKIKSANRQEIESLLHQQMILNQQFNELMYQLTDEAEEEETLLALGVM